MPLSGLAVAVVLPALVGATAAGLVLRGRGVRLPSETASWAAAMAALASTSPLAVLLVAASPSVGAPDPLTAASVALGLGTLAVGLFGSWLVWAPPRRRGWCSGAIRLMSGVRYALAGSMPSVSTLLVVTVVAASAAAALWSFAAAPLVLALGNMRLPWSAAPDVVLALGYLVVFTAALAAGFQLGFGYAVGSRLVIAGILFAAVLMIVLFVVSAVFFGPSGGT